MHKHMNRILHNRMRLNAKIELKEHQMRFYIVHMITSFIQM